MQVINPYKNLQRYTRNIAELIGLEPLITEKLLCPMRIVEGDVIIPMDDGTVSSHWGCRVQHNNARGPLKGGIRYDLNVNLDEACFLATDMTYKNSVVGLPFGGGKGVLKCNPKGYGGAKPMSKGELERLTRGYIHLIRPVIIPDPDKDKREVDPEKCIPAPDFNTGPEQMDQIADEVANISGRSLQEVWHVVTGKSVEVDGKYMGGSLGRDTATARGGQFVLKQAFEEGCISLDTLEGARVAIQGYGNAGANFARLAYEDGCKIVAISDSRGAIYNPQGLDPHDVLNFKSQSEGRTVLGYPGAEEIEPDALLEVDCDILVPAGPEQGVINRENADRIKAAVIVELANGPTTPDADLILYKKGIVDLPDILTNAGGVYVSYLEWLQNRFDERWRSAETIDEKLEKTMRRSTSEVFDTMERCSKEYRDTIIDPRTAAYILSMSRVSDAMRQKQL